MEEMEEGLKKSLLKAIQKHKPLAYEYVERIYDNCHSIERTIQVIDMLLERDLSPAALENALRNFEHHGGIFPAGGNWIFGNYRYHSLRRITRGWY